MKFSLSVFSAVTASVLAVAPAIAETPRPAPEFAIHMNEGNDKLLSSLRGKTVCMAFFYTTCPHCQDMAGLLSRLQPEYVPKGVQFIAAAFNDDAKTLTPAFVAQFVHGFPMGYTDRGAVLEFLQKSIMTPLYVPILVFVDRKGVIQDEYIGDSNFLSAPEKNLRAELDKVIAKGGAGKLVSRVSKK